MCLLKKSYNQRGQHIQKRDKLLSELEAHIRNIWTEIELRDQQLAPLGAWHKLPTEELDGQRRLIWIAFGKNLLQGERLAWDKGCPSITRPEMNALAKYLEKVDAVSADIDEADQSYAGCQCAMREHRTEMKTTIGVLHGYLKNLFLKPTWPGRNRVMRRFGFLFGLDCEPETTACEV